MSNVRILVGTRKGAFILTSDGARKRWKVSGPHFAGWEIYHMKGSPVNPTGSTCLRQAPGLAKSSSVQTMPVKLGTRRAQPRRIGKL